MKTFASYITGADTRAQFIRFLFTGAFNTLFGYFVFALLIWFQASILAALLVANVAGVILNFQTIGRVVFRRAEWRLLLRFCALYIAICMLNWFCLLALMSGDIGAIVGQGLLTPALAIISFVANKFFVFEAHPRLI